MSSSMRASPLSTLYWSCAKYSLITLWPSLTVPADGRLLAGEQLDERGLARAVHADQGHAVAALNARSARPQDLLRAVALRQPLGLHHHAPRRRRLRKLEVNHRLFFGNLDALDLFQFLDARLHLLGLGGLGAEAVDERLKVLDLDRAGCGRRPATARAARLFARDICCSCPGRS